MIHSRKSKEPERKGLSLGVVCGAKQPSLLFERSKMPALPEGSVFEMANAGKYHCEAMLIGGGGDFRIAH